MTNVVPAALSTGLSPLLLAQSGENSFGAEALYQQLGDEVGDLSGWDMQLGDLCGLQQSGHSLALHETLPPQAELSQPPQAPRPNTEPDPHSGDSYPARGRPFVPASVFVSGGAFPMQHAHRSLSPESGEAEHGSALHRTLVMADGRRKLEPWERRSSDPNPVLASSLTGSPPSPWERSSNLGPARRGGGLLHHQQELETGAYDNGTAHFSMDRPAGVQRRRSLRRGGSVRSYHHEMECRAADLSVQLEKALSANAMLEGRNQLLEQFVGLQAKHVAGGGAAVVHGEPWWLDEVTRQMVEQRLNLSGMLTFTLRGGRPINLTRDQVAALSWLEFCKLWQDYIKALQAALAEVRQLSPCGPPATDSDPAKRLARLVYETGILRGCLQTASPNRHAELLCFLPEGEARPPHPDAAAWRQVASAVGATQHQRTQLAQLRAMYLRVLGRMTRQRMQLVASLQAAVPVTGGAGGAAAEYEAALEGVESVRNVLRDEHSLLTQYKMIVWGRVLTPIQAAIATVQAYPWAADLPAIVNCIADEMGEPTCEALLNGQA